MICYKCNHEAGTNQECPVCGADLSIFQKVIRLSNMYYNDGLQKAEVRNLSGAIISLKKSLKLNKYNINARNLLGLVYYEMGEIVDALSEWVISKSYQDEDNLAGRYLDEIRQNRGQLQSNNQTIKKYNQAVLYCRQDSRDLAIIQLKKVLSLNPNMVKGHQLLALLYMQEDKLELAKKSLRSAGKIDANNTITLRYLKEVNQRLKEKSTGKKKKEDDLISYQSGNEMIIMPKRFQETSVGFTLVYILIGLVIGALLTGFLIIPEFEKKAEQEKTQVEIEHNEALAGKDQTIADLGAQVAQLQIDLQAALEQKAVTPEQLVAYDHLLNAYVAYINQDIVLTGNTLNQVDVNQLTEGAKNTYNTLWTLIGEQYYRTMYDAGYAHFRNGQNQEAVNCLQIVANHNVDYEAGNCAYHLAQAYTRLGNHEAAKPYYQYIVEKYPNTEMANTAARYLGQN